MDEQLNSDIYNEMTIEQWYLQWVWKKMNNDIYKMNNDIYRL